MRKSKLLFLGTLFSSSILAAPLTPINGGTGINNSNSNTITLGGPILTAGSFTISGAFGTTITVSATTAVTFPSGTHTLASNDGSNASGTWGINITGTAAGGAPPTGTAGGDLTGSYPNPTVASNAITYSKFQQIAADSLIGNPTGSLANSQGITLGSTLTFSGPALQTSAFTGDITSSANSFVTTLATVNSRVGTFGSASVVPQVTLNGKGLVTNETDVTITPAAIGAPTTTGTGASGTWGINITGTAAAGAPPTGAAGGSFLNGTYPNPGMVGNSIGNAQIRQSAALSIIGNANNSTTNVADIVAASDGNVMRRNGTSLGFGQLILSNSNSVTGQLGVSNGGNGTGSQQNEGILFNNGTINTSNTNLLFDGSSLLDFQTGNGASNNLELLLDDNVSGVSNSASVVVRRGDQANGQAYVQLFTYGSPSLSWKMGFLANDQNFYLQSLNGTALTVSQSSVFNFPTYTASQLAAFDSSHNLISSNLSGDLTTSGTTATLATVNSNVGSFGSATQVGTFTVNAKGLITAASNTTISGVPPGGSAGGDLTGTYPNPTIAANAVTNSKLAQMAANTFKGNNTGLLANPIDLTIAQAKSMLNLAGTNSGDVTLSGQNYLSLAAQVLTANAVDLSGTNATGILAAARFPALTGDITTSSGALGTTLATVNANTGSWGSSTQVPQFTVNGKGLITAVSNVTISGVAPGGSAGGDLTGTYPNPTIAANAVTYAKFQQVAANSVVGNSTSSTANATAIGFSATGGTSNIVSRDSNGNTRSNNTGSVATLVTSSGGTTSLTAASSKYQILQGTMAQTYTLPDATTLFVGNTYEFKNESTGALTVNNNGGSLIATIPGGGSAVVLCTAIGTTNGSWDVASGLPYATANTATTLVERDGSGNFSAGTITANLNGNATTASGAPPTGAAGGSFLNGTYPNPGIVANSISNNQIRQGFGNSVIGNPTGSLANVGDMVASSVGQVLRRDASLLEFGSLDLTNSNTVGSSVLGIANGGLNAASYTAASAGMYAIPMYNGSTTTNGSFQTGSDFNYNPVQGILNITTGAANPGMTVTSTSASTNTVFLSAARAATSNGYAQYRLLTASTNEWTFGTFAGAQDLVFTSHNGGNNTLTLGYSTQNVTANSGSFIVATANQGITIKSAAVSAGTANAAIITGVTLSSGAVTINNSYVTTSTVCYFSVVTPSGTPGTAYGVTVASGTVSVKSTSALDDSSGNVGCLKGN